MSQDPSIIVMNSELHCRATGECAIQKRRRCCALLFITIGLSGVANVGLASGDAKQTAKVQAPMNVVFIVADDLGYSDTTLYGTTWFYETPNIQELASRGVTFANAYSASPVCSAARASILTGMDPARSGFTGAGGHLEIEATQARKRTPKKTGNLQKGTTKRVRPPISATRMPIDVETLATTLRRNGYATAHFGKWHLGGAPHRALDHGFDVDVPSWSGPSTSYFAPWSIPYTNAFKLASPGEHIEDRLTSEAIAFMDQHRDTPFLLNYWAYSVHSPFEAKSDLVEKYAKRAHPANAQRSPVYAAMIENFDQSVGRLLRAVDRLGLRERTIVVFSSDNGGNTYDEVDGHPVTSNLPLRGGKAQLYEGGVRVPSVVVWPGRVQGNQRSQALFSSTDWFPTLLDMLGIDPPTNHRFDGVSQVPALLGQAAPRSTFFAFLPHYFPLPRTVPATSYREDNWKLIRFHFDGPARRDRFELYDLASDPGESHDRAGDHPVRVRAMDATISDYLRRVGAILPEKNPRYRPEPQRTNTSAAKNPS